MRDVENICQEIKHNWSYVPWGIMDFDGYWICSDCGVLKYALRDIAKADIIQNNESSIRRSA